MLIYQKKSSQIIRLIEFKTGFSCNFKKSRTLFLLVFEIFMNLYHLKKQF
jgi:hypothetical protein